MNSYIESTKDGKEYVAVLSASKCKTFPGFRQEMVAAFSLPDNAVNNTNDISGYIFSDWLGFKKIKIILNNSGSLKKDVKHFNGIMSILNSWKSYWESLSSQHELNIEMP